MARYGMVIDLDRCYGCRACMVACKAENTTAQGRFWMYVYRLEEGKYPETQVRFLPRPCMHCDNAPCVKVCPVQARYKREDGLVATDWDRCIGCRYCAVACPYGVNYFNWTGPSDEGALGMPVLFSVAAPGRGGAKADQYLAWEDPAAAAAGRPATTAVPPYKNPDTDEKMTDGRRTAGGGHLKGVMEKCTFCVHRVEKGLQPACVVTCPVGALKFGDLDNPESPVSKLLRRENAFRLKEDLNTQPKVFYIGRPPPAEGARQIEPVKGRV